MKAQILIYLLLILIALWFVWIFNRMIRLKKRAEGAWSDIDVQLKRRHELIPNLVTCVQGYVQHEKGTLLSVTEARQAASVQKGIAQRGQMESELTQRLKSLVLLSENYPNLKANAVFLDLQRRLAETENSISYARRYYNAVVRDYNILIGQFPHLWVAQLAGFESLEFFQLEDAKEASVQGVSLS